MNLTGAALGAVPMNYEAALIIRGKSISLDAQRGFSGWWDRAWDESIDLSPQVIDSYEQAREQLLEKNPDLSRYVEASEKDDETFGSSLWIEAGAMSGASGNQIEFAAELVKFFGPVEYARRQVRLRYGGDLRPDRPLSTK